MNSSQVIKLGITAFIGYILASAYVILSPIIFYKPIFTLALPAVFCLLLLLTIKPEVVLILVLITRPVLEPFLQMTRIGGNQGMGIGAGLNLAVILLFFAFLIRSSKISDRLKGVNIGWILFLFFAGLAIIYSPTKGSACRLFMNFFSYFCMAMLPLLIIKNKENQEFWQKVILISIIVTVIAANLDMIRGGHYFPDAGKRVGGTFTHPNILAFYAIWAIVFILYILKSNILKISKLMRNILVALVVNLFILLIATKSRNAWVAAWGMFFVYGLFKDKRILFVTLILPPLALLIPPVHDRIMDLFLSNQLRDYQGENSFSWRVNLWIASFPMILQSPIWGHGLSSFLPLSVKFFDSPQGVGAHNVYIELLFETGLLGLLSYLAIFTGILNRLWKTIKRSTGEMNKKYFLVLAYVISYLIINIADNMLFYLAFNWYFWFFIGLVMAGIRLEEQKA